MTLSRKKILFGVSGGIAAYKAPELVHGWIKSGFEVETILTKAAESFVSPLSISTLSRKRVWREEDFLSARYGWLIPHISLTEWADVFVVAPCTANVLRQAAAGDGSTLLGAALLANTKPLLIFPAMNSNMLENEATRANIKTLVSRGAFVIEPDCGVLACGAEGKGRLPSQSVIDEYVKTALCAKKDFASSRVAVTAGPTHEYIDPVRYISNPSSGKMGFAIARAAHRRGAEVTLITGPVSLARPVGVKTVEVTSADEMYDACMEAAEYADVIIKAAAVGDYKPTAFAEQKIKRGNSDKFTLELTQNRDIAASLGAKKREGQIIVGFAAETENVAENALKKLKEKRLDLIVSNDVTAPGSGFGTDTNGVTIIRQDGSRTSFSGTKEEVADFLLSETAKLLTGK